MKIVIIGAGISGCAAYLQLRKHLPQHPLGQEHDITIYEAYGAELDSKVDERGDASDTVVGGGLGLGVNGLRVLERLDQDLLGDVVRSGYATAVSNFKSKSGFVLARLPPATVSSADGQKEPAMNMVTLSRHALWKCLRKSIPAANIVTKRVDQVLARSNGRNTVTFTDNTTVEADLVLGADGLKSVAKRAILTDPDMELCTPHYEGLCVVSGFVPYAEVKEHVQTGSVNFIVGGNGSFGYLIADSAVDAPHRDSPYHVSEPGENVWWWSSQSVLECPDPDHVDVVAVREEFRQRYKKWKDPVVQKILATANIAGIYPIQTARPLPTWERHGVVLVGDAAHALPPSSGQGASQALEDVEALAIFLGYYLGKAYKTNTHMDEGDEQRHAISLAAHEYVKLRLPHVTEVLGMSRDVQKMKRDRSALEMYITYSLLWILGLFPSLMRKGLRQLTQYNVAEEARKVIEQEEKEGIRGEEERERG